jgi:NADPH:quinone reductase-like Zn-dependent oxidoreductase
MVGRVEGAAWLEALPRRLRPHQIIDYQAEPAFGATVAQANPQGIDVYVDTASDPQVWTEALKTLARRARVAVIGAHAGPIVQTNNNWLFRQRVSILGCSGSTLRAFADTIEMAGEGEIQPHIDSVIPMADAGTAYRRLMTRQNHGKIVLRVADDVT